MWGSEVSRLQDQTADQREHFTPRPVSSQEGLSADSGWELGGSVSMS